MRRQGRWYERDMTRRKPSRARLRPFRLDDAADLCRIYPMFFIDNAVKYGSSRIVVAEADGHAVGFVMWGPALRPLGSTLVWSAGQSWMNSTSIRTTRIGESGRVSCARRPERHAQLG